jgi:Domain of unknown function (DUF4136)
MHQPRHRPYSLFRFSGLLIVATALTGCISTPPQPRSMQDPQANFNAFTTFAWDKTQGDQPVTIVDSNIRAAITSELKKKGYEEPAGDTRADLMLRYETDAAEKVKSSPVRIGVGMGGYGSNGAAGVGVSSSPTKVVREGTLVLRVIDPVRNAEVWNGRVSREIAKGGAPNQTLIQGAVTDLLKSFPSRGGQGK